MADIVNRPSTPMMMSASSNVLRQWARSCWANHRSRMATSSRPYQSRDGTVRPLNSSSRLDAVASDLASNQLFHCYACHSSMGNSVMRSNRSRLHRSQYWDTREPGNLQSYRVGTMIARRPVPIVVLWTGSCGNALVTCRSPADSTQRITERARFFRDHPLALTVFLWTGVGLQPKQR